MRVAFLGISILLAGCGYTSLKVGELLSDTDWNTRFSNNCGMPSFNSVRWVTEGDRRFLRFTLRDKDKGGCSTDRIARHSAPYWERAELKQVGTLKRNKQYTIDTTLRFAEGFGGERETFFQLHAYDKSCKQAYPPIMLKFDNTRRHTAMLTLRALQSSGSHIAYNSDIRIADVVGQWIDMQLVLNVASEGSVTLSIDGETLFSEIPFWIEPCGVPHIKVGIYRPGNASGNSQSIVDYDSIYVN